MFYSKMSEVNRLETPPTLIRTFYQKGEHHSITDYIKSLPPQEIYLYSWPDATLTELSHTIIRSAKLSGVHIMSFTMVAPDTELGGWKMVPLADINVDSKDPDQATLNDHGFIPGAYLDVAYTVDI